jgi:predicted Ser/Thr protein kinase
MEKIKYNNLPLIGGGAHGKVYRLGNDRCIKVCKKTKNMQKEYRVLKLAEGYPQFPVVYECKGRYMIREYIDGQNIRDYIAENGLSNGLAKELTELIKIFIKLKFKRIDIRMKEVFVTGNNKFKIIDTTRYLDKKATYPVKMLRTLEKLECKEQYMNYLKENYPKFYETWNKKSSENRRKH